MRNTKTVPACQYEWMLNLSLIKEIDKEANTPEDHRQLRFFANHYLNKTAPIFHRDLKLLCRDLPYQVGGWAAWNYHRMAVRNIMKICEPLNKNYILGDRSPLILTDTNNLNGVFNLKFHVALSIQSGDFVNSLTQMVGKCLTKQTPPYPNMAKPILLDLTDELTSEEQFDSLKKNVKNKISQCVQQLIDTGVIQHSDAQTARLFIEKNTTCICRITDNHLYGIKLLPIFSYLSIDNIEQECPQFLTFIIETGLLINPLSLRRYVLDAFDEHPKLMYAVEGPRPLIPHNLTGLYPNKKDFTQANFYMRACHLVDSEWGSASTLAHCAVLGRATVNILKGWIEEIPETQWQALSSDRVKGSLLQLSLFKIQDHLGKAMLNREDFNVLTQEIELVNAELATLMELFSPFTFEHFATIYENVVRYMLPTKIQHCITAGLGRTAVHVFSGINEILLTVKPDAVRVHCEDFYYEQKGLLGEKHEFERFMQSTSTKKVDLYVGQFNPNIDLDPTQKHYKPNDVVKDIQDLLGSNRAAERLIVAIDSTIDPVDSTNIKKLLAAFEDEIIDGRLNFVFFQSGPKFNTFGMDNYYGSPFFMVNNRDNYWTPFNQLRSTPAYQTDRLSLQWFSLSHKYAMNELGTYRQLIFNNTRAILNRIALFQSKNEEDVRYRIATADLTMDVCFIDIKTTGYFSRFKSHIAFAKFYYMMREQGIIPYSRAAFGFFHTNYIIIESNFPNTKTIRINPGINPDNNEPIVAYLAYITDSTLPDNP